MIDLRISRSGMEDETIIRNTRTRRDAYRSPTQQLFGDRWACSGILDSLQREDNTECRAPQKNTQSGSLKGMPFKVQKIVTKESVDLFYYSMLEGESNEERYHPYIPMSSSKAGGNATRNGKQTIAQLPDTRKLSRPSRARGKQPFTPSTREGKTSYKR